MADDQTKEGFYNDVDRSRHSGGCVPFLLITLLIFALIGLGIYFGIRIL